MWKGKGKKEETGKEENVKFSVNFPVGREALWGLVRASHMAHLH